MRNFRAFHPFLACLLLLFGAISPAHAARRGRRVAVVVGVSHYGAAFGAAGDLSAPVRNAEAMAATLGRLGYEVRLLRDARAADILTAVGGLRPGPADSFAFFAYAATPGDVAYDGQPGAASLSPFTFALVEELRVPDQDIGVVMRHVRARVAAFTGGRQLPWSEDALTAPLVLNEAPASPGLAALWARALRGERGAERELGLADLDGRAVGAVFVLAVLAADKVAAAQPLLDRLAAARVIARKGEGYALHD